MRMFIILLGLFVFPWAYATEATTSQCHECRLEPIKTKISELKSLAEKVKTGNSHWVDGMFFVETKDSGTLLDVEFQNALDLKLSAAEISEVSDAYLKVFSTTDLNKAVAYATTLNKELTTTQKNLLMSMMGTPLVALEAELSQGGDLRKFSKDQNLLLLKDLASRLSANYSKTKKENKDIHDAFKSATLNLGEGGICGDIHKILGSFATALGFESVGRHNGLWQKDLSKNIASGHAILHFKDPQSGEYYVQNYTQIYRTKQKTLQGAIDVSSKILGVMTGSHTVESLPGKMHLYVPATALWVQDHIEGVAKFKPSESAITIRAGQQEQTVSMQIMNEAKSLKGFILGSKLSTEDGTYRLEAVGVSSKAEFKKDFSDVIVDEVKAAAEIYGGVLNLSAPGYDVMDREFKRGEKRNYFLGGTVKGSARFNSITGKLEVSYRSHDISNGTASDPRVEIKAGAESKWTDLNLKADVERVLNIIPKDIEQNHKPGVQTAYDRVGVVYDTSGGDKEAYVVVGSDVYFLEGVNKSSAIALRNSLKAVVPAGKIGTFSVGADLGQVVSNKSKDPWYEILPASSIFVDWAKKVDKQTNFGARVTQTKGTQITPFGVIGPITPSSGGSGKKVRGMIYLHSTY